MAMAYNLDVSPSLTFNDAGLVTVNTGCNDASGNYSLDGEELTVTLDVMTDAFCEGDLNTIEEHILSVLNGTATHMIDGNRLTIENGSLGIAAFKE